MNEFQEVLKISCKDGWVSADDVLIISIRFKSHSKLAALIFSFKINGWIGCIMDAMYCFKLWNLKLYFTCDLFQLTAEIVMEILHQNLENKLVSCHCSQQIVLI